MPNMTLVPAEKVDAKKFDLDFKHSNSGNYFLDVKKKMVTFFIVY